MQKITINNNNKIAIYIIVAMLLLMAIIVGFIITSDTHSDSNNDNKNTNSEKIELPTSAKCEFAAVQDTQVFLKKQIDSLYSMVENPTKKAQHLDCICSYVRQPKENRLIIKSSEGDDRIELKTHLQISSAKLLNIENVDFNIENSQIQNVKIIAISTNNLLFVAEKPVSKAEETVNETSKSNSEFRLPTSFVGKISGKTVKLNLNKVQQNGSEYSFIFNLISADRPLYEQNGTISTSEQIIKLDKLGAGKYEQKAEKLILRLEMETIIFESVN